MYYDAVTYLGGPMLYLCQICDYITQLHTFQWLYVSHVTAYFGIVRPSHLLISVVDADVLSQVGMKYRFHSGRHLLRWFSDTATENKQQSHIQ